MNLIVAVDEKWGIGKDGGLLAHLPEDMKYFRETTSGRTVVMGRRTLESFPGGKPLKNRVNMVLSRNESYSPEGVQVYHRAEDVLEALKDCNEDDVFIIGGGMIYREFLPYCNKPLMWTRILKIWIRMKTGSWSRSAMAGSMRAFPLNSEYTEG